ncbi:MAG: alanine dehydrogenase [Phycisphaerae bacterium]
MRIGVIGTSRKPDERRVPVHPDHLAQIDQSVRSRMVFEAGYGRPFDLDDAAIAASAGGVAPRAQVLAESDLVVLPKPLPEDLLAMRMGAALCGWVHLVQQKAMAQAAIDRRLTVLAWESMNYWTTQGQWQGHVFARNNEIAGYAAVIHALGLVGMAGHFGPARRAAVIGFGSTGQGALRALTGLGFRDTVVYVPAEWKRPRMPSGDENLRSFDVQPDGPVICAGGKALVDELAAKDVIVNCILQDPNRPIMYLRADQVRTLRPGFLIVDVSCDRGMGFPFARPTSIAEPVYRVGAGWYYAVDHTPSFLWRDASWEISRALLPFWEDLAAGLSRWETHPVLSRTLEMRNGEILNQAILAFQRRDAQYPHAIRG